MQVDLPAKLDFLFEPHRYKVMHGGRGGAKSWGVARALLVMGAQKPLRILCAREFQNSIKESVHSLIGDQISELGLDGFYEVQSTTILGKNGTQFFFDGLRHNVRKIKSYEAIDVCWVEEAATVSKSSWDVLIPTIRKDGSEIWISFNPELESDETYQRFVANPPQAAKVIKIGWQDNPWFPSVLKQEMDDLRARDMDAYLNVWEGHCRVSLEGAIYAKELREAQEQSRITRVPVDPVIPVHTVWDLGYSDNTSIWLVQSVGFEWRLVGYMQDCQKPLAHYLKWLKGKDMLWGKDFLPHDARAKQLGTGQSIQEMMEAAGRDVEIVPQLSVSDGINAARTVFDRCWFDADACADGIQCLRHYRYEVDTDTGQFSRKPVHDWASHGADAFRYFAVSVDDMNARSKPVNNYTVPSMQRHWD